MTESSKGVHQLIATWASFIALCAGISTVLVQMGRRDAQLVATVEQVKEMNQIVSELAKAQVAFTLTDAQTAERLKEIAARLDRLEQANK